jgi:phosphonate transport system ATP-binding protein
MIQLELQEVSKKYNKATKALDSINLTIHTGEFVAVIGTSGAGKSTLFRCINQLISVTSGSVIFQGKDVTKMSAKELRKVRSQMGMIFQSYNLVERLSVRENTMHGLLGHKNTFQGIFNLYTTEEKKSAYKILEKLQLTPYIDNKCSELSGGQKQRVGIARALLQNPKILLCDEPIASLDPASSTTIMDELATINKEMGITCLVNLHQLEIARKYAHRIIGIKAGKIVFDGKSEALTQKDIDLIYDYKTE